MELYMMREREPGKGSIVSMRNLGDDKGNSNEIYKLHNVIATEGYDLLKSEGELKSTPEAVKSELILMGGNNKDIYNVSRITLCDREGKDLDSWIIIHTKVKAISYLELYSQVYTIMKNYDNLDYNDFD